MDIQLKRGLLDVCVLAAVNKAVTVGAVRLTGAIILWTKKLFTRKEKI